MPVTASPAKPSGSPDAGFFEEITSFILSARPAKDALNRKKNQLCKAHRMDHIPTDIEIYLRADEKTAPLLRPYLETKPTRTGSGVAVVATMTKPSNCPHGSCTYCPGGIKSFFGDTPKSYTGKEPSTMRGWRNGYDPYRIIFNRLEHYLAMGQNPEKVDQIIMGGTFTAFPPSYQEEYVRLSFQAYNDFSRQFYPNGTFDQDTFKAFFQLPGKVGDKVREEAVTAKILALKHERAPTLALAQEENEHAAIRCIGLTVETKPDWGFSEQGIRLLSLGTTRVELGVQTVYDDILTAVHRGHTLADTKRSIADLRDLGFKLNFHLMPGLPEPSGKRVSRERDLAALQEIFANPDFRPDMLKIYPCMVMPGTVLEQKYHEGTFVPLTTAEAADIIVEAKRFVPPYCRIMRVQRDIPTYATEAGVDRTNLRQYVSDLAAERGVACPCIRCREVKQGALVGAPDIQTREYAASSGTEFFISAELGGKLYGFVRLRLPPRSLHPAITPSSALIRELHVYGSAVGIGADDPAKAQHRGTGKRLMAEAERIAKAQGKDKMVVISGVGAREYYRKLGYAREGPYMAKRI